MMSNYSSLSLLLDYESDGDNDSGYTSGDEKKRKADTDSSEIPCPKRKPSSSRHGRETEDMVIDDESLKPVSKPIHLPEELLVSSQHIDDPLLHQGRQRSFPHERGNWASLLYIPLDLGSCDPYFKSLVSSLCMTCKEHNVILTPSSEFHISLSQTLILRLHWIEPLLKELKTKIKIFSRFSCCLHGLKVYTNDEKTRTFLGIKVWQGKDELKEMTVHIDECLSDYKLPQFYKDLSFHVSVAWCVGDRSAELEKLLPLLEGICKEYFFLESDMRAFDVKEVEFKTGNRIHHLPLNYT